MRDDKTQALQFLKMMECVYDEDDEMEHAAQTLNMNDVWGWGTAWAEYVPDAELPVLVDLVRRYGWCGALYWMSERHDGMRSEFADINRMVEFVRAEEAIARDCPDSSERAYLKRSYTVGGQP